MNRCLGLAALLLANVVSAYPIAPQTLWNLSARSQVIVVAKVERLHDDVLAPESFSAAADPDQARGPRELARLRVTRVLKGSPGQELDVVTEGGMVCPAPGRFIVGKTVLAFLSSFEGRWHVTGLSYGTLYPAPEHLAVFEQRIQEAAALQAGTYSEAQKTDWAVRTAAHAATRWHGAYELASGRDRRHSFYDSERSPVTKKLDAVQQKILADGFIAEPTADRTTALIAELLRGYADPRVDQALVGAVDALMQGSSSFTAFEALAAVVERAGGDVTLLEGIDPEAFRHDFDVLRRAWDVAKKDLKLPPGTRVKLTPVERGVGAETPD